jgi:hypothetical protein
MRRLACGSPPFAKALLGRMQPATGLRAVSPPSIAEAFHPLRSALPRRVAAAALSVAPASSKPSKENSLWRLQYLTYKLGEIITILG